MKRFIFILLFVFPATISKAQPGIFKYDVAPAYDNSFPQYFEKFGDQLCFFAAQGTKGWEPWVADSTGSFKLISDVNTQLNKSSIEPGVYKRPVCVANGKLYFSADNGFAGAEIYSWAGGTSTPSLALDLETGTGGSYPDNFVVLNNVIYFKASTAADGFELWQWVPGGFSADRQSDINPGSDSSVTGNLTVFSNKIYFTAQTPLTGNELFEYDPLLDTATIIADLNPGPASSNPEDLTVINGRLYFTADNGVHGRELFSFVSGGSPQRLTDINPGVSSSVAFYGTPHIAGFNNKVYFTATNGNSEYHMYSFDPTNAQTVLACSTNNAGSSDPTWLTNYGGKLYFSAYDTVHGFELRAFDGTNPPVLAAEICEGKGNGKPQNLTVIGNNIYFRGSDCDTVGDELFRYNYVTADIKNLKFDGTVRLYPNPVTDYANLEMTLTKPATLSLELIDMAGRMLWQLEETPYAASKHVVQVPFSTLPAGTYIYRIYDNEGRYGAGGSIIKR